MAKTQDTTREARAQQLITEGRVTLRPGTGTALVRGSKGETYVVTREACSCLDFVSRGVDCKHRLAAKELCSLYRECAKQARETGRVTIPPALMRAIGGYRDVEAPPPPAPVPAGALVDDRGVAYCHNCGEDLINGYCPREAAERHERMAA